jgi:hypothetical protein
MLVGKLEGKGQLGRPRLRWEDNIKMDLQETRRGGGDWPNLYGSELEQVSATCKRGIERSSFIKCGEFPD